eukprot:scaffold37877_cov60-Phaeocystis_antarctica.AAC.6
MFRAPVRGSAAPPPASSGNLYKCNVDGQFPTSHMVDFIGTVRTTLTPHLLSSVQRWPVLPAAASRHPTLLEPLDGMPGIDIGFGLLWLSGVHRLRLPPRGS